MANHTHLLIIGAGPFGLSMAAYAKFFEFDHLIIGQLMNFWKLAHPTF